jgi:thymidine kinase
LEVDFSERGQLYVFSGPMSARKTGSLLSFMDRITFAGKPWQLFKPASDDRPDLYKGTKYGPTDVISRGVGETVYGLPGTLLPQDDIKNLPRLLDPVVLNECGFVGIDEVTLLTGPGGTLSKVFIRDNIRVIQALLNAGCSVVTAGLDKNYRGQPYGPMPHLLAMADHSEKLTAICMADGCNKRASMTMRSLPDGSPDSWLADEKVVGARQYQARCRGHHEVTNIPQEYLLEHFL